jgi:hypothetical protein
MEVVDANLHDCVRCGREDSGTINVCLLCLERWKREPELLWAVEVLCSGGWRIVARFALETDAWDYGATQLLARVYCDYEFRGERRYGAWSGEKSDDA